MHGCRRIQGRAAGPPALRRHHHAGIEHGAVVHEIAGDGERARAQRVAGIDDHISQDRAAAPKRGTGLHRDSAAGERAVQGRGAGDDEPVEPAASGEAADWVCSTSCRERSVITMRTTFLAVFCAMLFACSKQPAVKPVEVERMAVEQAAPQGDAIAPLSLALAYVNGFGVAEDAAEAVKWFRKAAEQRDACAPYAQIGLALMYSNGAGVAKDPVEAVKLYRKAAEQENAHAQWRLGWMLYDAESVKDRVEGVKWIRKAAEQGNAVAQKELADMYETSEGLTKDAAESSKWQNKYAENPMNPLNLSRKYAEEGDAGAQFDLGASYANGEGVVKDLAEAVKWYRKAAEHGLAAAQLRLGISYYFGEGVGEDPGEAVKWILKAAESGNARAQ